MNVESVDEERASDAPEHKRDPNPDARGIPV